MVTPSIVMKYGSQEAYDTAVYEILEGGMLNDAGQYLMNRMESAPGTTGTRPMITFLFLLYTGSEERAGDSCPFYL